MEYERVFAEQAKARQSALNGRSELPENFPEAKRGEASDEAGDLFQVSGRSVRDATSPFDEIRRVHPDGTEFWSARDLMRPMGYEHGNAWVSFESVIDRAKASAENQGFALTSHFTPNREKTAGRDRQNYYLTRFAAYLVAMNGDPRKPEVAAAQAYFAIQTRVAEVSRAKAGNT
ncbi:BRO family protein [Gordonia sp. (in: high G+C Gram-positive bacteria)]|uniref:BRO family protein n=1 Tax=Gordonia sp. (in: high G+C Gram-positive bacteria) TaxID=84139 RepID=UPI003C7337F5